MGNAAAKVAGIAEAPVTLQDSVEGMIQQVGNQSDINTTCSVITNLFSFSQ